MDKQTFSYKGREVSFETAGFNQSIQNISIDGAPRTWVCFPTSAIETAKQIIDNDEVAEMQSLMNESTLSV